MRLRNEKKKHILPIIILFVIHINCSLTQWSVGFDFKVFSLKRVHARWGMSWALFMLLLGRGLFPACVVPNYQYFSAARLWYLSPHLFVISKIEVDWCHTKTIDIAWKHSTVIIYHIIEDDPFLISTLNVSGYLN